MVSMSRKKMKLKNKIRNCFFAQNGSDFKSALHFEGFMYGLRNLLEFVVTKLPVGFRV